MNRIDFNRDWRFHKAGSEHWQVVDLPHDAMIHERRDPDSAGSSALGFFAGGIYIYEKTFSVPAEWGDKCLSFEF